MCPLYFPVTTNSRPVLEIASSVNSSRFDSKLLYYHLHCWRHYQSILQKYGPLEAKLFATAIAKFPNHPNNYKQKQSSNSNDNNTNTNSNSQSTLNHQESEMSSQINSANDNKIKLVFDNSNSRGGSKCKMIETPPELMTVRNDEKIMIALRIVHDTVILGNALNQSKKWFETMADCGGVVIDKYHSDSSLIIFLDSLAQARKDIDFETIKNCINFTVSYDAQTKHSIPWFGVLVKVRDEMNRLQIMFLNGKFLLKKNKYLNKTNKNENSARETSNNSNNSNTTDTRVICNNNNSTMNRNFQLADLSTLEDSERLCKLILAFLTETKVKVYDKMNGSCSDGAGAAMSSGTLVCCFFFCFIYACIEFVLVNLFVYVCLKIVIFCS